MRKVLKTATNGSPLLPPCPARKNWANGIPLDGKQDSIQEASARVRPPFGSRRTFFTDHPNRFSRLFSAVGIGSRAEAPPTTLEWLDKAYGIYIHHTHTPSSLARVACNEVSRPRRGELAVLSRNGILAAPLHYRLQMRRWRRRRPNSIRKSELFAAS